MIRSYKDWSTGKEHKMGLPIFSCATGEPAEMHIYFSHYQRLEAVVDAARSGNQLLLKLAVAHHDEHGSRE